MPIKQPPLRDIPVALPSSVQQPDPTGALIVEGVTSLAQRGLKALGEASAAEEHAATMDVISDFEDDLVDASTFAASDPLIEAEREAEEQGIPLTADQRKAIQAASQEAAQINSLEAQTGQADRAKLSRTAIFRRYKTEFPELAGQLRKFFKQHTGQSVGESVRSVEEEHQDAAIKAEASYKVNLVNQYEAIGFSYRNETAEEMEALLAPYKAEIYNLQQSKVTLDKLKTNREITSEKRLVAEERAAVNGSVGSVLVNSQTINETLSGFDATTATAEEMEVLTERLKSMKIAYVSSSNDQFIELSGPRKEALMSPTVALYDNAILVASGKITGDAYKSHNALMTSAVLSGLHKKPGFTNLSVRLSVFRDIAPNLIGGTAAKDFSKNVVLPLVQMLYQAAGAPSEDHAATLALETDESKVSVYEQLKDFSLEAISNFNKPDPTPVAERLTDETPQQVLGDILQGWTNKFSSNPEDVPMGVYSQMLDVASQPGTVDLFKESPELTANIASGFRAFSNSMRASLADDLAQEQGSTVVLFKSSIGIDKSKLGLLEFIEEGFANRYEKPTHTPRLFRVLNMTQQPNGDIIFTPIDDPRIKGNAQIQQKARHMTKVYGQRFGKLVRSYAHTILGNEDYKAATAEFMEFPEWDKAYAGVRGKEFNKGDE